MKKNSKKWALASIFLLCSVFFLANMQSVGAHDLIAPEVRAFMAENPTATGADIAAFAQSNSADEVAPGGDIFSIVSYRESIWGFITGFSLLGLWHVLIGLDHILFIITIVLVAGTLRQALMMSLIFTLAHSITFILAGTTALALSSSIVEPLIALSIAVFAIYSILHEYGIAKGWKKTGTIIFLFGLVHGLGFAGVLTDLQMPQDGFLWSLLLFNVGIEIGQFVIVGLTAAVLWLFAKSDKARDIRTMAAVAICVIALWWCVERTLLG